MKSQVKTSVSDEDFSQEKDINFNYNKIMTENKELKSKIAILESSQNNFMKLYFKYKEISDNLTFDIKKLTKERDGYKKKKAVLNNEIKIIKMNNDKINNIKIRNNILINNNLDIKTKINNSINNSINKSDKKNSNSKKKNNKKENMNIKINKISSNDNLDIINFKRSKSEKNTIKLNKNKNLQSNIKGKIKIIKNSNNKKFPDLICQKKVIVINYKDEKEKNDNQNSNEKKNNSNFDNQIEKKYNIIIEKLKSEIKIKEQYITKYELEKQIAEKNRKAILDSNSYQINGLNELIKLLKDKNQKLNVENEKLRNKEDEKIIELIKELNYKDKEISSLNSIINKLKKELNNNGIDNDN